MEALIADNKHNVEVLRQIESRAGAVLGKRLRRASERLRRAADA